MTAADDREEKTEEGLLAMLSRRYATPTWAFFPHVPSDLSGQGVRIADGIAVGVQPATHHEIIGFEVKVSRADWLRELKDWTKSQALARYCDRWYLVVSSMDIVKQDELPPDWGMFLAGAQGLLEKVKAPLRIAAMPDRAFVASLARQTHRKDPDAQLIKARESVAYDRGVAAGKQAARHLINTAQGDLNHLKRLVDAYQTATGFDIERDRPERMVPASDAVARDFAHRLVNVKGNVERIAKSLDIELEKLGKLGLL